MRIVTRYAFVAFLLLAVSIPATESKAAFGARSPAVKVDAKVSDSVATRATDKKLAPTSAKKDVASPSTPVASGAVGNALISTVAGSLAMVLIDAAAKKGLADAKIDIPSSLVGCLGLFAFLLLTEVISPSLADSIYEYLSPGAAFLAKWMSPFYVPGLVILPLAPSIGGASEIAKVVATIIVGLLFTLASTAFSVIAIRSAQGTLSTGSTAKAAAGGAKTKAYDDATWNFFLKATVLSGALSIVASRSQHTYAHPIQTIFLFLLTMTSYVFAANLPKELTATVHPLAISAGLTLLSIRGVAEATNQDFMKLLKAYKVKSGDPMKAGAGGVLLYFLSPTVVGFAVSVFGKRQLLFTNWLAVLVATLVASGGSLLATAAFVRAIGLGSGATANMLRLSVLSRNVTTSLAMAITTMLGGDLAIAASVVVITGILGGTYGKAIMEYLGIRDPIARGLTMGASALGLGVYAVANEPEAYPLAVISMVATGVAATSLVSIPAFKDLLIRLATGSGKTVNKVAEAVADHVVRTAGAATP